MLNTLGVVQIRAEQLSSGWKTWRGFGGKSLIEWVVRRATESQRLDGVIVVAPAAERDELTALIPTDVPLFTSSRPDALGQFAEALYHYSAVNVVRLCLEHPFVDPVLIDRLVVNAATDPKYDYIGFCTNHGQPLIENNHGCCAELCKTKAIRIADRDATSPADRAQVTSYLYQHLERFQVSLLPLPGEANHAVTRLALNEHAGWDRLSDLCEALGEEPDYQRLQDLLSHQQHQDQHWNTVPV